MKSFLAIIAAVVTVFSFSITALAQQNTDGDIPAIYETETDLYISIKGDKIKSTQEIHAIFQKALSFPAEYKMTFADLETYLSNPKYTPKQVHITIYSGGILSYVIGEKDSEALLDVLNNAQEKNYDKDGFKNLTIFYWQ